MDLLKSKNLEFKYSNILFIIYSKIEIFKQYSIRNSNIQKFKCSNMFVWEQLINPTNSSICKDMLKFPIPALLAEKANGMLMSIR